MAESEPKRYTLWVHYVGPDGHQVAEPRRKSCIEGLLCTVSSPEVAGLRARKPFVAVNLRNNASRTVIYDELEEW